MSYFGANVVSYTYDDSGNALTRTPGTNPASSFIYDPMNRVTKITHNFAGANGGAKVFNYTYDEVGNRMTAQREGGVIDSLGYDKNSQMTSYSLGGAVSTLTYDESGNRTKLVAGGVTTNYTPNGLNQYTLAGSNSLGYSGNGNVTGYAGWTYSYDALNRLTSADIGGTTSDFYYDGLGRQVARKIGTATIYSVWDGANRVAEYAPGGSATALNRWVYAGGDLVRSPMPQQIYYYADGSGSTSYLADGTGLLLEKYTYDVGGKPTFLSPAGVVLTAGGNYTVDMLFTGQKWYVGYGILDLRARAYLAGLGRFLQPDPIGFGGDPANLYRYCANNPFNCSDPSGEGFQYTQYGNNVNFYLPVSV